MTIKPYALFMVTLLGIGLCRGNTNLFKEGGEDPALTKLAESGDAAAMSRLGDRLLDYNYSVGKEASAAEAAKWFRRAAELGNPRAQAMAAVIAITGYHGTIDEAEALGWARKSADGGDLDGQFMLAQFYRAGIGTPRNPDDEPLAILERISAKGHGMALSALALGLVQGSAGRIDVPKAVELDAKANAAAGGSSLFWTTATLAKGQSLPPADMLGRYIWAKQRVSTNHPVALHIMGLAFSEGEMGPVDYLKANAWFRKAAEAGHLPSWERLGYLYEKGLGVAKDVNKAAAFYQKAGSTVPAADEALKRLGKQSPAESNSTASRP